MVRCAEESAIAMGVYAGGKAIAAFDGPPQKRNCLHIFAFMKLSSAIDHRTWKTGLPVRSAVLKPCAGRLVVGWVTTSEYLLLIVLHFLHLRWWYRSTRTHIAYIGN
jgi:hypothetical protein